MQRVNRKESEMENKKPKIVTRRSAIGATLLVTALSLPLSGAIPGVEDSEEVQSTRDTLDKWVETRRILSKEKHEWTLSREMLTDRIDLMVSEIESLRARIGDAETSIADADKKRGELIEENESFKQVAEGLEGTIVQLETRTRELLKRLPDPIRERVKPLSQRLPEDPKNTKTSLSERFQNVVGILNEVDKFNREITVASEVRTLTNGKTAEVTALYVGIGQAYYVNTTGTTAGVGTSSKDGWSWTPANEAAGEIAKAIAILKNEQVAEFVLLPVEID